MFFFIELEKAYCRVPREIMRWTLEQTSIWCSSYIETIKNMMVYDNYRTVGGDDNPVPTLVGLHQRFALRSQLFELVTDGIRQYPRGVSILYIVCEEIALVLESREGWMPKQKWRLWNPRVLQLVGKNSICEM